MHEVSFDRARGEVGFDRARLSFDMFRSYSQYVFTVNNQRLIDFDCSCVVF